MVIEEGIEEQARKLQTSFIYFHSTSEQPEDVSLPLSDIPDQVAERSLEIDAFPDITLQDQATTFHIVTAGSKKGGDLLVDSLGFTYTKKFSGKTTTSWMCSARGSRKCFATVSQWGDAFVRGKRHRHNHPGDPGALLRCKATKMVSFVLINSFEMFNITNPCKCVIYQIHSQY